MFLKTLTIRSKGAVVRQIQFRRGLNVVVDETSTAPTDSGNNVGKTTFLRVIDYCLGANGKAIYEDSEFKKQHNDAVFRYLKDGDVEFELVIENHLKELSIVRSFANENRTSKINGEELSAAAFRERLGIELFGLKGTKPSFRQLISKFIRIAPQQIANTIYYLHTTTPKNEYEPVYLFLFGFREQSLLERRRKYLDDLKKYQASHQVLSSRFSKASLTQILKVLDHDVTRLRNRVDAFQISGAVVNEINELDTLRVEISSLSLDLSNAGMRLRLNQDAIQRLEKTSSEIDTSTIEQLYREASVELPALTRRLSDVIEFHNRMIVNKIRFIRISIDRLEAEVGELRRKLDALFAKEQSLLQEISKKGALADYHKLNKELEELISQRAGKESLLLELERVSKDLDVTKISLKEVNDKILVYRQELERRLGEFNLIFSDFSRRLYGDEYVLSIEFSDQKESNLFDISISNIRGNEGAGKKRAEVSAFDLAYLEFLSRQKATSIRFTLHDRVEDVSINQLKTLFEIAEQIDGQYVVAVLRDKLESIDKKWIGERTIMSLSQDDRFFRIP